MNTLLPMLTIATLCVGTFADDIVSELSNADPTMDRLSDTGAIITGDCDGVTAPDSVNDDVPYQVFYFQSTGQNIPLDVTVTSLEAQPIDFDPFLTIYCDLFIPGNPDANLLHVNDDGAGYPNAFTVGGHGTDPKVVYAAVVSSYSNWAPSRLGEFRITLGPGLEFTSAPCIVDYTDDGLLDFFDVSEFLDLFGAQDPLADLDNNGLYDFFDVSAFLDLFGAGCP